MTARRSIAQKQRRICIKKRYKRMTTVYGERQNQHRRRLRGRVTRRHNARGKSGGIAEAAAAISGKRRGRKTIGGGWAIGIVA
jgi:hypothetical protein